MKVSALFAGIAGIELGLEKAGHETLLFCEIDSGAQEVLKTHFPNIPIYSDIRQMKFLPRNTELITAGFPCQDLSQAGQTQGINGMKTGVVSHLFRLLRKHDIPNVLIENVPFMLYLKKGQAIRFLVNALEELDYKWAYRVVDARAFGVPQRRQRVFMLASKEFEPWRVLLDSDYQPRETSNSSETAYGFYWTEGRKGLGWAVDAIPTLKGGSSRGIPSPPAIWMPDGRIVTPHICDAERLQGFRADWTKPAEKVTKHAYRWNLLGNSVCVRASIWIGKCISRMPSAKPIGMEVDEFNEGKILPKAAFGSNSKSRAAVCVSVWPSANKTPDLSEFLRCEPHDLSFRATNGFINRLTSSSLSYPEEFLNDLVAHRDRMAAREN